MANSEHLEILKEGIDIWNKWREGNPDVRPDLSQTDLRKFTLYEEGPWGENRLFPNLRGANLSGTDLHGMILSGVDMGEADLNATDLSSAVLSGVDLSDDQAVFESLGGQGDPDILGTNLRGAYLCGANLRQARLFYADLRHANLSGADLTGACLDKAVFQETIIGNACLVDTTGLMRCIFRGPCVIDLRTIRRSGDLPESFLRGCGLPDILIDQLPSLLKDPEFYSCFISYSTKDYEFATRLHADLQKSGVRCWFAPDNIKIGDIVHSTITEAIRQMDKVVLVLSEAAIESDWVEHEVDQALEEEKPRGTPILFPIRVDDAVMSAKFGWAKRIREAHKPTGRHIGDFSSWKNPDDYRISFERLLRDLKV